MNRRGFTMPEIMISIGSFAIIALILSSLWVLAQRGLTEIMAGQSLSENVHELRLTLTDVDQCTRNLTGTPLSLNSPDGAPVASVRRFDTAGNVIATVFESGRISGGLTMESITIKPKMQIDWAHLAAELEINYRKPTQGGEISAVRHMNLIVHVKGDAVQRCWLRRDLGRQSGSQTCWSLTGGALNEYDPVAGECVLTNGRWITGPDPYSATCSAGTELPKVAWQWTNCRVIEPSGFTDPTPDSDGSPYWTTLDNATKTCRCIYDVNIPPAVLAGFKCEILCQEL